MLSMKSTLASYYVGLDKLAVSDIVDSSSENVIPDKH